MALTTRKPMQRKTPLKPGTKGLKRTGFHKKLTPILKTTAVGPSMLVIDRYVASREERAAAQIASALETRALVAKVGLVALVSSDEAAPTVVKDNPLRHEGYRRLVAAMPCAWCGRQGRSNHAHENSGKGKAMKVDDRRAMPLCVDDMGQYGCHTAFDQYALIDGGKEAHAELGARMAKATRSAVRSAGKWPKTLPAWIEDAQ